MTAQPEHVVVIGGGHGGANFVALMRQHGYEGRLTLIGTETRAPYQRPPLSKDYLKGVLDDEHMLIKPTSFYAEQRIDVRWGVTAMAIDPEERTVLLDNGETLAYDALVLATGAGPREIPVPGAYLAGVHYLRTYEDSMALGDALGPGKRLAIVGGGYVGLEVAASARHLGCDVVVLEREPRALARVAGAALAQFLVDHHRENGAEIVTGAVVTAFRGNGHVDGVLMGDGSVVECDAVVVGVGAIPRTELAEAAGLWVDGGVVVDDCARSSADGVYAIGDVTRRPLHHYDGTFRLESIPSAVEQAKQATCAILGQPSPRHEVPWFWSDQYDLKIKIAGLISSADRCVVRGDPATAKFAVFHLADDRVVGAETVNASADFMLAKKLIESGATADVARLADVSIPVKELVG